MARIDRYRLRRLDALEKAAKDVAGLAVQFRQPVAMVVKRYAANVREERKRRRAFERETSSVFALMLRRYAKALKAQRKREAAYNDAISGEIRSDKLEALESWLGPRDLAPELREVLSSLREDPPPTPTEFAAALKNVIAVSDHSVDYLAAVQGVRKRIARRKGAK